MRDRDQEQTTRPDESSRLGKAEKTQMTLTSQQTLRKRILRVLRDINQGSAPRKVVLEEMDRRFGLLWTQEDRLSPKSRPFEQKWMNRSSYERANMVREGLLTDAADGVWALTSQGRCVAEQA